MSKGSRISSVTTYCIVLLVSSLIACTNTSKKNEVEDQNYSSNQKYLFQIIADYKKEYFATDRTEEKSSIQAMYQYKMERFLVDSLRRYIDSMTVTVDTIIQKGLFVTSQFHSKDIEFKYGMTFKAGMPVTMDSLYKFLIKLKSGEQLTLNFIHSGGGELNYPDDKSKRIMRIFAFPAPLEKRPDSK